MNQELSQRLKTVASFVKPNAHVADIGCDHAYLPIYLVRNRDVSHVIGSEIAQGPLENGKQNILKANLSDRIELRWGKGVETLNNEDNVDTVTIAGMGGKTIVSILADGLENQLAPIRHLVLQPNTDEWYVRFWLWQHGYRIDDEVILEEKKNTYEVISATYTGTTTDYQRADILFGPYLRREPSRYFIEKYQRERDNLIRIMQHIPSNTSRYHYVKQHLEEIEAVLNE